MAETTGRALAVVLAATLALTACDSVEETVGEVADEAGDTIQLVEFCTAALDVVEAVGNEDTGAAIDAGEIMVAEAPDEIAPDAQTVLDGVREAEDNPGALQSGEFRSAAESVASYTGENCDPTN